MSSTVTTGTGPLAGEQVAGYAAAAGFAGDALITIVAIGRRESNWNPDAQGDLVLQDSTWGPSVGIWQIRTLRAETGTGGDRDIEALMGNPARQAQAAFTISGGGTNFSPWSTYAGLSSADLAAATTAAQGATSVQTVGILSGASDAFAGAIDDGLGAVVGADGPFSDWLVQQAIRAVEVLAGALILAAGLMMLIDVIGTPAGSGNVQGPIRRGIVAGKKLATEAATAAAMAG